MSFKRVVFAIALAAMVSILSIAATQKENKNTKNAKKTLGGVQTPGVQIPFSSLKSEADIKLEAVPNGAAFTTEALFAAGNVLRRIDAKTNKPGEPITGLNNSCGGLLSAFANLWTVNCGDGTLSKIEPKTGKLGKALAVGKTPAPIALAASADSVWLLADDKTTLVRIDPKESAISAELRLPAACSSLVFAETSLWVACPGADKILRIDPLTNLVDKRIDVAGQPVALAAGEGFIWVLASKEGKVFQIDPKTNKSNATIDLGVPNARGSIAFGQGSVWVSVPGFPITRILASTTKVVQQFAGDGYGLISFGLGSVWLADPQAKSVSRFDPKRILATLAE